MPDDTSLPSDSVPDWEAFLRQHQATSVAELDLTTVKPGDRLLVVTERTAYTLVMGENRSAELSTNRADRPAGRVVIHGCTFGASSSIKPDYLFCGGNLEFAHGEKPEVFVTTTIRALQLAQATRDAG